MKTYIIDSELLPDEERIKIGMRAIFSTPSLDALQLSLATRAHKKNIMNIGKLVEFCFSEISKLPANSSSAVKNKNTLLVQLLKFQAETVENGDVYNPQTKVNPLAVGWPDPKQGQSVFDTDILIDRMTILDKSTPVGSAGSCFAMEIAHWLQCQGFNYLVTEKNIHPERGTHWSNARWGTIFNAPAFRQLVERSFGVRKLPNYLWRKVGVNGREVFRDPFREEVEFESVREYELDQPRHVEAARLALSNVKIFIITLGLNEVWSFREDGSILSRNPWRISPSYVSRQVLGVEENMVELQRMLDIWRKFNPELKLIVSVSPVPMLKTFRASEMHVMAATMLSKSTLRVAAQRFCDANSNVYYFPSFEKIMYGTREPWEADYRHVRVPAVAGVMSLFAKSFVAGVASAPDHDSACSFIESIGREGELSAVVGAVESLREAIRVPVVTSLLDQFLAGYRAYTRTGITPATAYQAMRQLFVMTNGAFNNIISERIKAISAVKHPPSSDMIFGNSFAEVLSGLNSDGYWVFDEKLEFEEVDQLVKFALDKPAVGRAGGDKPSVSAIFSEMRKHGNSLFQFDEAEMVSHDSVWRVCKKPVFADLARRYLQCEPILDLITMWWSLAVPSSVQERSSAAQLYHFDLDRLSFLKFFIYLSDVDVTNGPHCYIAGSHRGFKSVELLRDGRFSDDEIKRHYPNEEVRITGKRGTIFVADTKGFHRGLPLESGERLIFQIEFCNSLFGAPYNKWRRSRAHGDPTEGNPTLFAKLDG